MTTSEWTRVAEVGTRTAEGWPILVHPGWRDRFPWLLQGTTHRGEDDFDLRRFGTGADPERAHARLERLTGSLGFEEHALSRQVHGSHVLVHGRSPATAEADGHVTNTPGVLLAVTLADCVPVFVIDPEVRCVALLHAGWRGAAAGVLERGVERLIRLFGSRVENLRLHLGPSICGDCYEVGPEVFEALDRPEPSGPAPIDLRDILANRALDSGLDPDQITVSTHCTLHGDAPFYSHRGGDTGRQAGLLGVRPS